MNGPGKQYIGAALVALALFLFWALDVGAYRKLTALRAALQERDQVIAERKDTLANIKKFKADLAKHTNEVRKFSAVIPTEKEVAELVSALESIALQNGIQITKLITSQGTASQEENYNKLSVVIEGQGGYAALRSFLGGIEQNNRLFDVQSLEASVDPTRQTTLFFKLQGNVYFLK